MALIRTEIMGSVNIGNYAKVTNGHVIVTGESKEKRINELSEALGVVGAKLTIRDCRITSPFFGRKWDDAVYFKVCRS